MHAPRLHRPWAGPVPADAPALADVHAVHDRYVVEIVEEGAFCPFARKCREDGRLHRVPFVADGDGPPPEAAAGALARIARDHDDAEIVLLVFVPRRGHRFWDPQAFDAFTRRVREAYADLRAADPRLARFYAVAFHPLPPAPAHPPTPENLVPTLRRSPDPLIQCVHAEMLDALRADSQKAARARTERELARLDPALAARFREAIVTDPELSSEIARRNFDVAGIGPGRTRLEAHLDAIFAERCRRYPDAFVPPPAPTGARTGRRPARV